MEQQQPRWYWKAEQSLAIPSWWGFPLERLPARSTRLHLVAGWTVRCRSRSSRRFR